MEVVVECGGCGNIGGSVGFVGIMLVLVVVKMMGDFGTVSVLVVMVMVVAVNATDDGSSDAWSHHPVIGIFSAPLKIRMSVGGHSLTETKKGRASRPRVTRPTRDSCISGYRYLQISNVGELSK